MAPKNILPRKKIADFIDNLYDGDLHAKRVLSLANATLGVLVSASSRGRPVSNSSSTVSTEVQKPISSKISL